MRRFYDAKLDDRHNENPIKTEVGGQARELNHRHVAVEYVKHPTSRTRRRGFESLAQLNHVEFGNLAHCDHSWMLELREAGIPSRPQLTVCIGGARFDSEVAACGVAAAASVLAAGVLAVLVLVQLLVALFEGGCRDGAC